MKLKGFTAHNLINVTSQLSHISDNPISTAGTFGIVKRGKFHKNKKVIDPNNDSDAVDCAIKYIKINDVTEGFEPFNQEIKSQNLIKHPALLQLLGYSVPFCGKGRLTLVTPYMEKGSLRTVLIEKKKGNSPEGWDTTKRMITIIGIAAGLYRMHQENLIHRDIKPENILLDNNYHPKICDFGYSKIFNEGLDKIVQATYCGTESYMAPEILTGGGYNSKVDVYAYGLILYELFTNETFFEKLRKENKNFLDAVVNGKRPDISKDIRFKPFFRKLISDCWVGNPDVRPSFADILESLLDAYKKRRLIPLKNEINEYIIEAIDGSEFDIEFANKIINEEIEEEEDGNE